jgi:hypothetical protein
MDIINVDYREKIPNNVNLTEDRRGLKALEGWHPGYLDWWRDMGPEGFQESLVYLRTAVSVDPKGWAKFDYIKMPEYRWGILLAAPEENRRQSGEGDFGRDVGAQDDQAPDTRRARRRGPVGHGAALRKAQVGPAVALGGAGADLGQHSADIGEVVEDGLFAAGAGHPVGHDLVGAVVKGVQRLDRAERPAPAAGDAPHLLEAPLRVLGVAVKTDEQRYAFGAGAARRACPRPFRPFW